MRKRRDPSSSTGRRCIQVIKGVIRKNIQDSALFVGIDNVGSLVEIAGSCERLFRTPIPTSYTSHTSRFLTIWALLLPFGEPDAVAQILSAFFASRTNTGASARGGTLLLSFNYDVLGCPCVGRSTARRGSYFARYDCCLLRRVALRVQGCGMSCDGLLSSSHR